jgi:hypothetical protein
MRFVTTGEPIYNRFKDMHIKESYETNSQKEIGILCGIEGLLLEGSDEHKEWLAKRKPVEKPVKIEPVEQKHKGHK